MDLLFFYCSGFVMGMFAMYKIIEHVDSAAFRRDRE